MFSVIFEVLPTAEHWDDYFSNAKMLRPELDRIDGFIDNTRYTSLTRERWILSLSSWRDEKSLIRWRTSMRHNEIQRLGRDEILADYHLRVGQLTTDSQIPQGQTLKEQRFDETEVGEGTAITLITATRPKDWTSTDNPYDCAEWLGLNPFAADSTSWDLFDAILDPSDLALLVSWKDQPAAEEFASSIYTRADIRIRQVRVIRDYGKYDRREAPQYFPDAPGGSTVHA